MEKKKAKHVTGHYFFGAYNNRSVDGEGWVQSENGKWLGAMV